MQYSTCHHVKEDGTYCGSPSLHDRHYCYYHLQERARRLRRARALRDNQPYRLEIHSLDNLYALRIAIADIGQALASDQLDPRVAGKLLYAVQLASSTTRRIDTMEAEAAKNQAHTPGGPQVPAVGNCGNDDSRLQAWPDFERQLGLAPGADIDAEIAALEQKADEEAQLRRADALPAPPPGLRPGSPAYHVYQEEAYQAMRLQITDMRRQLRDYNELKRQQFEALKIEINKKEVASTTPAPQRRSGTE
jgi:hypothetical protein